MATSRARRFLYELTAQNGWRWRVEIIPAQQDSLTNVTTLTDTTLPSNALIADSDIVLKGNFEKRPLGLNAASGMTVKFNLDALTGSTALTDLREFLLSPTVSGAGLYNSSGNVVSAGTYWISSDLPSPAVKFTAANVITLRSDFGNAGATMATADVVFQGVQKRTSENKFDLKIENAPFDVEFVNIGHYVLEQLPQKYLDSLNIASAVSAMATPRLYDRFPGTDAIWSLVCPSDCTAYVIRIDDFQTNINNAAKAMYRGMVRSNSANFTLELINNDTGGTGTMKMYKYGTNNALGAAVSVIYMIYAVRQSSSTLFHAFEDKDYFGSYKNLLDIFKEFCEIGFSKRVLRNYSGEYIYSYQSRIWDDWNAGSTPELTAADVQDGTAVINFGELVLRAAKVNLRDAGDADIQETEYIKAGSFSEEDFGVPAVINNIPQASRFTLTSASGSYFGINGLERAYSADRGKICYKDGTDYVKIHDQIDYFDGAGNTFTGTTTADVSPATSTLTAVKANMIYRQQTSCIPFILAKAIQTAFSGTDQCVMECEALRPSKFRYFLPDLIGDIWTINATSFKSYLTNVGSTATGVLLETECSIIAAKVKAKFLIKGAY